MSAPMSDFGWASEVCPRCDKPVYQGDWAVRCRCNGTMLRAEIERLQRALYWAHIGTSDDPAEVVVLDHVTGTARPVENGRTDTSDMDDAPSVPDQNIEGDE